MFDAAGTLTNTWRPWPVYWLVVLEQTTGGWRVKEQAMTVDLRDGRLLEVRT